MAKKLTYKLLQFVGEEAPAGNAAFENLERSVNEHVAEGWRPLGGVAVAPVVGPKSAGSSRDNWFVRVTQAIVREE